MTTKNVTTNEYEKRKSNNANFAFFIRTGTPYSTKYTDKEKKQMLGRRY